MSKPRSPPAAHPMLAFRCFAPLLATSACMLGCATVSEPKGPIGPQGWTRSEQLNWYHVDQGSRLLPLAWLRALEAVEGTGPLFTVERMASLGFLAPDVDDPTELPIGFAINRGTDQDFVRTKLRWYEGQSNNEPWAGLTCAACHTGEVRTETERKRIDGAPAVLDFQVFIETLDAALTATLADPARFDRFAHAVLTPPPPEKSRDTAKNREGLRVALANLVGVEKRAEEMNRTEVRYGFGRLDAFGHIFNKVALANGADQTGFEAPADAPVSYPFLWNVPQHDRVQWNGIAPNKNLKLRGGKVDLGGLARNAGEATGVFADVNVPAKYPGLRGYRSSISVTNLDAIEEQLGRLLPPAWPFTQPDTAQVATGRALFEKHCQSCHAPLARTDLATPIVAVMTPISGDKGLGTDPWMACNAFTYRARTGNLAGIPTGYVKIGDDVTRFEDVADTREMLSATVAGSLIGRKGQVVGVLGKAFFGVPRTLPPVQPGGFVEPETRQKSREERRLICNQPSAANFMVYKGRPLIGIWATAPYLHNGSVPSLRELLLPPAKRATSFPVGDVAFDPAGVGLGAPLPGGRTTVFRVKDEAGREIHGNSNLGHDYGNEAIEKQPGAIEALIAFMKTL